MAVLPVPDSGSARLLVFSPDNKLLAGMMDPSGPSQIPRIIVWDVAARQVVKTLSLPKQRFGFGLAFSTDGKVLAFGDRPDGVVRLWDLATGKARELNEPLAELDGDVTRLAFSPDGRVLAANVARYRRPKSATKSAPGERVTLWDVQEGRQLAVLNSGSRVCSLRFLPDGKTLALAREVDKGRQQVGSEVQFWDLATFQQQKRLGGFASWDRSALKLTLRTVHCDGVSGFALSLSPDGQRLATSELEKVAIWNVVTGKPTLLGAHPIAVHSLVFSPDSRTLATLAEGFGSADDAARTVRLWDLASGKLTATLKHPGQEKTWIGEVAISPDRQLVATVTFPSTRLYVWNVSGYRSDN